MVPNKETNQAVEKALPTLFGQVVAEIRTRCRPRCHYHYITSFHKVFTNIALIVLSHWPHVAEQVLQQVAAHAASVKGLRHKLPNLLLNLCPV